MGLFSSIGEALFGSDPDYDQATDYLTEYLGQSESTLSPYTELGTTSTSQLTDLLSGNYELSDLSGYDQMTSNVSSAIDQLGTGMAGTGKFFSGSTAEAASDISSEYISDLLQTNISNLMSSASMGQSAASQLAGYQYGTGTNLSNVELSDSSEGIFGDLLGAGSTVLGAVLSSDSGDTADTTA